MRNNEIIDADVLAGAEIQPAAVPPATAIDQTIDFDVLIRLQRGGGAGTQYAGNDGRLRRADQEILRVEQQLPSLPDTGAGIDKALEFKLAQAGNLDPTAVAGLRATTRGSQAGKARFPIRPEHYFAALPLADRIRLNA